MTKIYNPNLPEKWDLKAVSENVAVIDAINDVHSVLRALRFASGEIKDLSLNYGGDEAITRISELFEALKRLDEKHGTEVVEQNYTYSDEPIGKIKIVDDFLPKQDTLKPKIDIKAKN